MTEREVMLLVRERMGNLSQGAFARSLGVSDGNMSNMLRGRGRPSKPLLRALGLVAVVSYEPIAKVEEKAKAATVPAGKTSRSSVFRYGDWPVGVR